MSNKSGLGPQFTFLVPPYTCAPSRFARLTNISRNYPRVLEARLTKLSCQKGMWELASCCFPYNSARSIWRREFSSGANTWPLRSGYEILLFTFDAVGHMVHLVVSILGDRLPIVRSASDDCAYDFDFLDHSTLQILYQNSADLTA